MSSHKSNTSVWQIILFVLSIYVLVALFMETAFKLTAEQAKIILALDNAICFVFIGDFFYQLIRSKNRLEYLKWGWIDLVASVPNVQILRIGRFARIIRA